MTLKRLKKEMNKKRIILQKERDELRNLIDEAKDLDDKLGNIVVSLEEAIDHLSETL